MLRPHISKWWDIANDRRQRLIFAKYRGKKRLTKEQERELEMLQKVADAILEFASPSRLSPEMVKAARIAILLSEAQDKR